MDLASCVLMYPSSRHVLSTIGLHCNTAMSQLQHRAFRSIFLITYSQVDVQKCDSKERFSDIVRGAIERATQAKIVNWVVGEEVHHDGGFHYHMAIKLDRQQRWLVIRDRVQTDHAIAINFSDGHPNYYSAWLYATKEDPSPLESANHPDLHNYPGPRTTAATRARMQFGDVEYEVPKITRLTKLDVSLQVAEKNITSYIGLMALAKTQKR